jgi:hypothetical protein
MSLASFIAALSVFQALAQGWWTSLDIQVFQGEDEHQGPCI